MTYDDRDRNALDRLEDMLDAYAESRLTPSGPIIRRMRAHVLAQAVAAGSAQAAGIPDTRSGGLFDRIRLPRLAVPRRAYALGMAATFTAAAVGATLAAAPGTLLYEAKVQLQDFMLPTHQDALLSAHEQHLGDFIAEAQAAGARADTVALAAALAAYRGEVNAAVADVGADLGLLTQLQAILSSHVASLEELSLLTSNDVQDDGVIGEAIDASQEAVRQIKDRTDRTNSRPSIPPGRESNPPNRP